MCRHDETEMGSRSKQFKKLITLNETRIEIEETRQKSVNQKENGMSSENVRIFDSITVKWIRSFQLSLNAVWSVD